MITTMFIRNNSGCNISQWFPEYRATGWRKKSHWQLNAAPIYLMIALRNLSQSGCCREWTMLFTHQVPGFLRQIYL